MSFFQTLVINVKESDKEGLARPRENEETKIARPKENEETKNIP